MRTRSWLRFRDTIIRPRTSFQASILDFAFGLLGDTLAAEAGKDHLAECDCSLRVISGSQEHLGEGWQQVQVTVYAGGLELAVAFHPRDVLRAAWVPASPR